MWQTLSMSYKRLTLEEKERIPSLLNQGKSNQEISLDLKRPHTTISKELKRCVTKYEYSPSKAHRHAGRLAPKRVRKRILDKHPEIFEEVFIPFIKNKV